MARAPSSPSSSSVSSSSSAGGSRRRPGAGAHAPHNPWHDVPSLLMLGGGTLLFLALVSFQPSDVPGWLWYSQAASKSGASQNLVGNLGAIVAGFFFFMFGAASFFIAALLLLFGLAKLFYSRLRLLPRLPWMIGFVVTGACLLHLQHWFLSGWQQKFNGIASTHGRSGAGGWLGLALGEQVFEKWLFGSVGSFIVLGTIYVCCLILMTGLHPIALGRRACDALLDWTRETLRRRREARLARITDRERLMLEQKRLAKEQQRLEKQLRRQGVAPAAAAAPPSSSSSSAPAGSAPGLGANINRFDGNDTNTGKPDEADDEFADRPPPKITDNSAPPPPSPVAFSSAKKKPTPLEAMAARAKATAALAEAGAAESNGGDIRFANYELPDIDLLDTREAQDHQAASEDELVYIRAKIIETLEQFGIKASPGDITRGPTITRYEVYPARGVRVDKIVSLEKDIARATRAERINILAPIPGKDTVGIEIANSKKVKVTLRELIDGADWRETKAKIPLALGKDVYGKTIIADLAAMPHCLIAGATGSGKSVCINSIIASLLYKFKPEQLQLVMIDPKVVELQVYKDLPHLSVQVVTNPKKVLVALRWVIDKMMQRYELFARTGVRNITSFNARPKPKSQAELDAEAAAAEGGKAETTTDLAAALEGDVKLEAQAAGAVRNERDGERIPDQLPFIVVIVDELADLMQTAPADVESAIARITQMARAAGIHMIIATQTPRADVITGVIKANVPSRIAFQVASALDSRVILDENGAERLLGQGDMLYRPPGTSRLVRAQGVFVTDEEIHKLVQHACEQGKPTYDASLQDQLNAPTTMDDDVTDEDEELVQKCIEIMRQEKKCSTSMLQRRLRLGYTRAARVVDVLEARGVVGPENGARGRDILDPDILNA